MPPPRVRQFIVTLLLGAAVIHLAWSSAMAGLLASTYRHRMVDVRRWPDTVDVGRTVEMVSTYLSHTVLPSAPPTTVFFGSSVTHGFPWQEDVGFSKRYATRRPAEHVFNASVIGADLEFIENAILCGATNAGLHADLVLVELQTILSVKALSRSAFQTSGPALLCDETVGRVGHLSFAMRHPLGAGWLPYIWDNIAFPKPDRGLVGTPVYAGYFVARKDFAGIEAAFAAQVRAALNRAKTVGRQVYAYPAPMLLPGATDDGAGYEEAFHAQQTAALEACRSVPGVHCLDPESFYTKRELYWNLSHFNQRGHQEFADWLAERIPPMTP